HEGAARAGGGVSVGEDADPAAGEQTLAMRPSDVREVDEILRRPNGEQTGIGASEDLSRNGVDVDHRDVMRFGETHRSIREVASADHGAHIVRGERGGHLRLVFDAGRAELAEDQLERAWERTAVELGGA